MVNKIFSIFLLLSIYLLMCNKIYIEYKPITQTTQKIKSAENIQPIKQEKNTQEIKYIPKPDTSIGKITINKINLSQKIYPQNDRLNNIEKNVTILNYSAEPSEENSIIFIAAHSGTGKLAYFKNLDKLDINDIITLTYKNIDYTYQIKDIWETNKDGNISVEKEKSNQLILTTCSPTKDNYQLIINSILIKKES